jgi:uncharacterized membrane protein
MKTFESMVPKISYALLAAFLLAMAVRSQNDTTIALVACSLLMFAFCWANATHLLGAKPAFKFVLIAVSLGWFAEQMGSSRGWFFGSYTYTDVLGWPLGDVPMIIPLMWFALCYVGYVISNLIVWQNPVHVASSKRVALFMSFLAAAIVTAYDLGADPYMVYVLKAWIMAKTDGWWFGETLEGFFGWMLVSFTIIALFHLTTPQKALATDTGFTRLDALLPLSIYAFSMVFQMLKGHPVETRTVALFAMGIPLLCALAGLWRWRIGPGDDVAVLAAHSGVSNDRLAQTQYLADPLADETIAHILGASGDDSASATAAQGALTPSAALDTALGRSLALQRIALVNQQLGQWGTNQSLSQWPQAATGLPPDCVRELQHYLQQGQTLPAWADVAKIARAEALFMDYGALSCSLLFCSSLPECYVVPDLSAVLHISGQLEQHTEYRIRSTAAMIFPVMMRGGLTDPQGGGVAQILKVRLIHATIRHLILRGSPAQALAALDDSRHQAGKGVIAPLPHEGAPTMHEALFTHGWKTGEEGLPCSQDELAYTLLTFSYVFLRSMRRLNLGLSPQDEEAYLHLWNVVGHVLGIRRELMADTMPQAAALFAQMQARGRQDVPAPDARPALGDALMRTMENLIPFSVLKPIPVLFTRFLCGARNARDIGVQGRVSWLSRLVFVVLMLLSRCIDATVRLVLPEFSIARLFTRVLGYHFMSRVLLDQTRPLKLPTHVLNGVSNAMKTWGNDPKAPRWMNTLEDKLTRPGTWTSGSGA